MSGSTSTALRATAILAVRNDASCAAVGGGTGWTSTSRPRVVAKGTTGAINRGRMPMVVIGSSEGATLDGSGIDGGMITTTIEVLAMVAGGESEATRSVAETLLAAAIAAIRATHHAAPGIDSLDAESIGVGVTMAGARLSVENTYNADYEVTQ